MNSIVNVFKVVLISLLASSLFVACAKKGRKVPIAATTAKDTAQLKAEQNKATKQQLEDDSKMSKREKALTEKLRAYQEKYGSGGLNQDASVRFSDGTYEIKSYEVIIRNNPTSRSKILLTAENKAVKDDLTENIEKSLTLVNNEGEDEDSEILIEDAKELITLLKVPTRFLKETNGNEENIRILDYSKLLVGFNDEREPPKEGSEDEITDDSENDVLSNEQVVVRTLKGNDKKLALNFDELITSSDKSLLTIGLHRSRLLEDRDLKLVNDEVVPNIKKSNEANADDHTDSAAEDDYTNMLGLSVIRVSRVSRKEVNLYLITIDHDTKVETELMVTYTIKKKAKK